MCVAALGAVVIGAAEEAAVVVLLFAVGELLENVAAGRARAGIQALADLMPRTALRLGAGWRDGAGPARAPRRRRPGLVRPGDRVPCDGIIEEGRSAVDESPGDGRERAGRARPRRGGRRRLHQCRWRAARPRHARRGRQHHRPHHPPGRGGDGLPCADRTASSNASRPGGHPARWRSRLSWSCWCRHCLRLGVADEPLSRPRSTADRLPLRAGHLGAGGDGLRSCRLAPGGACWSRAARRSRRSAASRTIAFDKTGTLTRAARA